MSQAAAFGFASTAWGLRTAPGRLSALRVQYNQQRVVLFRKRGCVTAYPSAGAVGAATHGIPRMSANSTSSSASLNVDRSSAEGTATVSVPVETSSSPDATKAVGKSENATPLTFQDAILRLQEYWAARGCVIWHPYNTEVGAGTMNPATFLRVLGPEPWAVAYDEPSVRPDDSRYGENPNRLQCHTQFQVIVKPAPDCAQELVVGSYRALGIDVTKRDVRFVEDNWESPALGAWGLGWEVWLDGMEITQFTYFQQAGSLPLDSVAVEITYGLERIIMALQGKTHFKDIIYAPGITYGEILMQNEVEMSKYNLDEAEIDRNRKWFDDYEAEARQLLDKRLPVPAYNFMLKASQTFNVLDARGAVGVTERARFFQRMRTLARDVAQLWAERREELGHPLLATPQSAHALRVSPRGPPPQAPSLESQSDKIEALPQTVDLVIELGVEELPAAEVASAADQMRKLILAFLAESNLAHDAQVEVGATPRRVSVTVPGVQARQNDESKRVRGPPLRVAVDEGGALTKAGKGFLRSQNITDESLAELDEDAGYMYVTIEVVGKQTAVVLADDLAEKVFKKMTFGKTMRWNESGTTFSRPVRWLLCLLDDVAVPFEFAGVKSGLTTRSLRGSDGFATDLVVSSAQEYPSVLEKNQIVASRTERALHIRKTAIELAEQAGGNIPEEYLHGALLEEVTDLVENPIPILGRFDDSFLNLPDDVLVTVMKKHQRYLPVLDAEGNLVNAFVAVVNGDAHEIDESAIRQGNEAVLRARYSDAAFFYENDTRDKKLRDFLPVLDGLTFQEKLGSMLDKVNRVKKFTPALCDLFGLTEDEKADAIEAVALAKADLGTSMVVEMTSLAGIMGRHYALRSGEVSETVAEAIFDAALPRFSGDLLPRSNAGAVAAVADRLDSLVSLFSVGLMPKATADPFALRRAALGVLQTLIARNVQVDIRDALRVVTADEKVAASVLNFMGRRLEAYLGERGIRPDVVKAVLVVDENAANPCKAFAFASALVKSLDSPDDDLVPSAHEANGRAVRLVKSVLGDKPNDAGNKAPAVDDALFEDDVETALLSALSSAEDRVASADSADIMTRVRAVADLKESVDAFCDTVYVSADDEAVKMNRVAMLQRVANLTSGALDLTLLQL